MRTRPLIAGAAVTAVTAAAAGGVALAGRRQLQDLASHADPNVVEDFARPTGHEVDVEVADGTVLATVSVGDGPTIVLAHGWTADVRAWALVVPHLVAAGHRVVLFDQRGHGLSTVGADGFSVDALADDYRAVLETLDLHDVVVAGHSMGGIGLQSLLLRHPGAAGRVRACAYVASIGRPPPAPRMIALQRGVLGTSWFDRRRRGPRLGTLWALWAFGRDPAPSHVEAARRIFVDCPMTTAVGFAEALRDFDFTDRLHTLTQPSLVLCGTEDRVTWPAGSRELHERLANATIEWFPNAGHILPFERADETAKLIADLAARAAAPV